MRKSYKYPEVLCWKCYRTYRTSGYCAGSATQGSGIVLKGVQTSQNHRVPVRSKKSTLDTLCEYPTEHTFVIFLTSVGSAFSAVCDFEGKMPQEGPGHGQQEALRAVHYKNTQGSSQYSINTGILIVVLLSMHQYPLVSTPENTA